MHGVHLVASVLRCVGVSAVIALLACGGDKDSESDQPAAGSSAGVGGGAGAGSAGTILAGAGGAGSGAGEGSAGVAGSEAGASGSAGMGDPGAPVIDLCPEPVDTLPMTDAALGVTVLVPDLFEPRPIYVDDTSIWFADTRSTGDVILRMPKEGGATEIVAEGLNVASPEAAGEDLYWLQFDDTTRLFSVARVPLDAVMATPEILASEIEDATHFGVGDDALFYADRTNEILYRLELTEDAMPEELLTGIVVQGMDVHEGYVYFSEFHAEAIMRVPVTGGEPEMLASAFFPQSVRVSADGVFYAGSFSTLEWVPLTGGTPVLLYEGGDNFDTVGVAAAGESDVFWYQGDADACPAMHRSKADGSDHVRYAMPGPVGPLITPTTLYFGSRDGDFFDPHGVLLSVTR